MNHSKILLGGLAVLIAVPAIAQMADARDRAAPVMRSEVEARIKQRFADADANRDGSITREEIAARREAKRQERRDRAFARLDEDGNGAISRAEFDTAGNRRAERRAERGGKRMRGHQGRRHAAMAGMMWGRADANEDGRISLSEALARPMERFDRADSNRDGTLTPEERRDAREKMRDARRERRG